MLSLLTKIIHDDCTARRHGVRGLAVRKPTSSPFCGFLIARKFYLYVVDPHLLVAWHSGIGGFNQRQGGIASPIIFDFEVFDLDKITE